MTMHEIIPRVLFSVLALTAPIVFVGCGGGTTAAVANKTNAEAPVAFPTGAVLTYGGGLSGVTTITGANTFSTVTAGVVLTGSFTYVSSGGAATMTQTASDSTVHTLVFSSFNVAADGYASAMVIQDGVTPATVSFSGMRIAYAPPPVTPAPLAPSDNPIKVGASYLVTASGSPDTIPAGSRFTIGAVSDTSLSLVDATGSAETLTRQTDGSYLQTTVEGDTIRVTSNADGSLLTYVYTYTDAGVTERETSTLTRS